MSNGYIYWIWSNGLGNINKTKRDEQIEFKKQEQNKKEKCMELMSKRKLITQTGSNPYMINNNYLEDLNTQSKFLMPKNSNFNKEDINL